MPSNGRVTKSSFPQGPPALSVEVVDACGVVVQHLPEDVFTEVPELLADELLRRHGAAGRPWRHAGRVGKVRLVEDVVGPERLDGGTQGRPMLETEAPVDLAH